MFKEANEEKSISSTKIDILLRFLKYQMLNNNIKRIYYLDYSIYITLT